MLNKQLFMEFKFSIRTSLFCNGTRTNNRSMTKIYLIGEEELKRLGSDSKRLCVWCVYHGPKLTSSRTGALK